MKKLEIIHLPIEQLRPNPWNVNRMPAEIRGKLHANLQREGLVEPIVVRPQGDFFEILGGEHRWRICKEDLGYETMPCVVVELEDRRAKILSVNLNELRGQSAPELLARLVHDLTEELSIEDLASQLPYTKADLDDLLEVLKIPDGLKAELEAEAERAERERPQIVTFVVDDLAPIERAIEVAQARGGPGTTRGKALLEICRAYLTARTESHDPGDPSPDPDDSGPEDSM